MKVQINAGGASVEIESDGELDAVTARALELWCDVRPDSAGVGPAVGFTSQTLPDGRPGSNKRFGGEIRPVRA